MQSSTGGFFFFFFNKIKAWPCTLITHGSVITSRLLSFAKVAVIPCVLISVPCARNASSLAVTSCFHCSHTSRGVLVEFGDLF